MTVYSKRCLFAGSGAVDLVKNVAAHLPDQAASPALVGMWANGETRVQLQTNVRGADVFIFQSFDVDVNDRIMELILLVDAALRASAERITVVAPYLPYSKQEKKVRGREPIAAKVLANMLTSVGVQRVVSVDLHARAIQAFYDMPFDHLTALGVLADRVRELGYTTDDCVVVAPDEGAMEKSVALARMLGLTVAAVMKTHPEEDPEAVETAGFIGDVRGKRAIIWDDMILGGSTLVNAAEEVIKGGAKEVIACITHAILCGDAIAKIEKSKLSKLIISDTTPPKIAYQHPKIEVASIAKLLAQAIDHIHRNLSVSELLPEEV
ncbi:MAG: ribose-phosphate diphosphokinase [Candidatus Zipacnadales bacterium]